MHKSLKIVIKKIVSYGAKFQRTSSERCQELDLTYLTYEPCSGSSVGSPLTKVGSNTIWAALVVSRAAELRSCLIESAHLVLGRPLGLFQPWMFGLKS